MPPVPVNTSIRAGRGFYSFPTASLYLFAAVGQLLCQFPWGSWRLPEGEGSCKRCMLCFCTCCNPIVLMCPSSLVFFSGSCPGELEQFFFERGWWSETERLRSLWPLGTGSLGLAASGLAVAGTEPCRLHSRACGYRCEMQQGRHGRTPKVFLYLFLPLLGFWLLQKLVE